MRVSGSSAEHEECSTGTKRSHGHIMAADAGVHPVAARLICSLGVASREALCRPPRARRCQATQASNTLPMSPPSSSAPFSRGLLSRREPVAVIEQAVASTFSSRGQNRGRFRQRAIRA